MSLKPVQGRLEIKEGMSVKEVQEKGNAAQKAAATIFDKNGDGAYDHYEAYAFNNTRITADSEKGEIRLYDKDSPVNAKPTEKVDIEAEKADYAKRTAKYQKFEQILTRFGIDIDNADWVGINDCEVKTVNGKSYLVLKAVPQEDQGSTVQQNYELSIPIDSSFDPKNIKMYRAEDHCNIHFDNLNGTLKILGNEDEEHGFAFGGNSNVTVIGKDGVADMVAVEDKATVKFKTGDYADTVINRGSDEYKEINLKPGTTTVKADK